MKCLVLLSILICFVALSKKNSVKRVNVDAEIVVSSKDYATDLKCTEPFTENHKVSVSCTAISLRLMLVKSQIFTLNRNITTATETLKILMAIMLDYEQKPNTSSNFMLLQTYGNLLKSTTLKLATLRESLMIAKEKANQLKSDGEGCEIPTTEATEVTGRIDF